MGQYDIYPLKPARIEATTTGATTKPLTAATAPHNYQLHTNGPDTIMFCNHCGDTYRFVLPAGYWVKVAFVSHNLKALDPPGACALPEAAL